MPRCRAGPTCLRGAQVTGADGRVTFTTICPGWCRFAFARIHFQLCLTNDLGVTATSQLAFPQSVTAAVHGSAPCEGPEKLR